MGRFAGSRNRDHQASRNAILARLWEAMARSDAPGSFRDMSRAAAVSPATLRHYFSDATGVMKALLEHLARQGEPYLAATRSAPETHVRESLTTLLQSVAMGWRMGLGAVHTVGLSQGLGHEVLGPVYVNHILEPTLQATEARLAFHVSQGELAPCDLRHAALELMSPVILGLLHQVGLSGAQCRPLELEPFLDDVVNRFLLAHPNPTPAAR